MMDVCLSFVVFFLIQLKLSLIYYLISNYFVSLQVSI